VRRARLAAAAAALLAGLAAASPARAAGTYENLLDRARQLLTEAERARNHRDDARGVDLARQAMALLETSESIRRDALDGPFLGVQAAVLASDVAEAESWLARYVQRNAYGERDPGLHYARALVESRLRGRHDLALRSLDRLRSVAPGAFASQREVLAFDAHLAEATRGSREDDHAAAARHAQAALAIARRREDAAREVAALNALGAAHQAERRWADAAAVYDDLRRRDPGNPYWPWFYGSTFASLNRWREAIPHYEEVVRRLEADDGALLRRDDRRDLRFVYLRLGNSLRNVAASPETEPAERARLLAEARERIARFQHLLPDEALGHYWMGVLLLEDLDRPYEAIPHLRRAQALDPVCDAALRHLIRIHTLHPPPPPPGGGSADETEKGAWSAELERLRADEERHRAERERERARREKTRPTRDTGCE
jgi:tetratricopeptide (TPR) repeat protein